MDWDDLRVFLAVAEVGSLSGAARRLRVSQATVWRRIQSLEFDVGAELFERYPTGYVLTPAGARLAARLGGLTRTIETACERLDEEEAEVRGEVRVAAPDLMGAFLAHPLAELHQRHPRLVVELVTASPASLLPVRDVDIALRVERVPAQGFALEAVFRVSFGLYASRDYLRRHGAPETLHACEGHTVIRVDHAMGHLAPAPWLAGAAEAAEVSFRANNPFVRMAACRAGLGLLILPYAMAQHEPELVCVLGSDITGEMELSLYVATELAREPRVAVVRDFLLEECPRLATPCVAEPAPVGRVMVAE